MRTIQPSRRARRTFARRTAAVLPCLALMAGAAGCRTSVDIPYSELKARVEDRQVREVRMSPSRIEAVPTDAARQAGAPDLWSSIPIATDTEFVPLLDARQVVYRGVSERSGLTPAILGLVLVGAVIALVVTIRARNDPAWSLPGFGRLRSRRAQPARTTTRFKDVAGIDEAKEDLEEIVSFLKEPRRFAALGARVPKGVLLVGPAGTGKTLLARAVAGEANVPFFAASGAEFVEMYVGVGASRIRKIFQRARAQAPAIVFIDELDAIGKSRGSGQGMGANDEREHTLNQLLVELDGFEARDGLIVMAATNRADTLDSALLRPGRFDRQVLVDRPDAVGRAAILQVHARRLTLAPDADLDSLARGTPGFSGADLENLLNEAALLAARTGRDAVGMIELEAAIDRVVAGLERKNRRTSDKEKGIVAYHEAGHAVAAELAPTAEPVRKVSIVPRGAAALGFMQQLLEDRYLLQEDELLDRLVVLLGGRAAESLAFGQFSTGASNDLERATTLARRMVCEYGMSPSVGPMSFGPASRPQPGEAGGADWSEEVTARIEAEVQSLLARAFGRACADLERERPALDRVAGALLQRGSLDREELLQLMAAQA
jgi:cell division protease FtsH